MLVVLVVDINRNALQEQNCAELEKVIPEPQETPES